MELNQTNGDGGHLEPGSFLKKSTSGKNRLRSADHQEVIASDKKLDPSYNICQVCFLVSKWEKLEASGVSVM